LNDIDEKREYFHKKNLGIKRGKFEKKGKKI
jgi:hypothetical protein